MGRWSEEIPEKKSGNNTNRRNTSAVLQRPRTRPEVRVRRRRLEGVSASSTKQLNGEGDTALRPELLHKHRNHGRDLQSVTQTPDPPTPDPRQQTQIKARAVLSNQPDTKLKV